MKTNQTKPNTATIAYREAREEVTYLARLIENGLADHAKRQAADPKNWGHLGDLNRTKSLLNEALRALGVPDEGEDGDVAPGQRCPQCGEKRMDHLVWTDDDTITCQRCGTKYDPAN